MSGFEPVALATIQAAGSPGVAGGARWLGRRGRNREATMSASLALQHVVDRANLRASHLLTIHAARTNPLDLISGLGGYPLVVTSVERLAVDMSEAIDCWRKLRLSASPDLTAMATEVLNALAHRIGQVDPGWLRPRKRKGYRNDEVNRPGSPGGC